MDDGVVPHRLERMVEQVGFEKPMLREAGLGRYSMQFHLPDNPPRTLSRPIASAVVLEAPETGMAPDATAEYTVGEITIRFPQAPEHYYESATAIDAMESAWANAGLGGVGRVRLNQVVENRHAPHVDIDRGSHLPVDESEFLDRVWDAAEDYNQQLHDSF